jgi:hypothetical protein
MSQNFEALQLASLLAGKRLHPNSRLCSVTATDGSALYVAGDNKRKNVWVEGTDRRGIQRCFELSVEPVRVPLALFQLPPVLSTLTCCEDGHRRFRLSIYLPAQDRVVGIAAAAFTSEASESPRYINLRIDFSDILQSGTINVRGTQSGLELPANIQESFNQDSLPQMRSQVAKYLKDGFPSELQSLNYFAPLFRKASALYGMRYRQICGSLGLSTDFPWHVFYLTATTPIITVKKLSNYQKRALWKAVIGCGVGGLMASEAGPEGFAAGCLAGAGLALWYEMIDHYFKDPAHAGAPPGDGPPAGGTPTGETPGGAPPGGAPPSGGTPPGGGSPPQSSPADPGDIAGPDPGGSGPGDFGAPGVPGGPGAPGGGDGLGPDGGGCFVGETQISTASGLMPIGQLHPESNVWAFDRDTQKPSIRKIIQTFNFCKKELLTLDFDSETICCTPFHRFFTGVWTPAYLLSTRDRVMRRDGGWEALRAISEKVELQRVFNLHVEDLHNYFVGRSGLLVHNEKDLTEVFA